MREKCWPATSKPYGRIQEFTLKLITAATWRVWLYRHPYLNSCAKLSWLLFHFVAAVDSTDEPLTRRWLTDLKFISDVCIAYRKSMLASTRLQLELRVSSFSGLERPLLAAQTAHTQRMRNEKAMRGTASVAGISGWRDFSTARHGTARTALLGRPCCVLLSVQLPSSESTAHARCVRRPVWTIDYCCDALWAHSAQTPTCIRDAAKL